MRHNIHASTTILYVIKNIQINLIILVLFIFGVCYFDYVPHYQSIQQLKKDYTRLELQLRHQQKSTIPITSISNVIGRSENFFAELSKLIQDSNLKILTFKTILTALPLPFSIHLGLNGEITALAKFLINMQAKFPFIVLTDFILDGESGHYTLNALVMDSILKTKTAFPVYELNGFCQSRNSAISVTTILNTTSVSQMRMIGYLRKFNNTQALLLISDKAALVSTGEIIGSEHALITAISPKKVSIRWNSQNGTILHV